jgi:hypothetical protein
MDNTEILSALKENLEQALKTIASSSELQIASLTAQNAELIEKNRA